MSKANDINLEKNGRVFPNWIMKNFKRYILPEVIRKEGEDPCNEKIEKDKLTVYQEFIGKYLDYRSPFRDILLYHGVGAGKTVSVINVYNILYNYTPKWNIFLLIPAALHDDPWLKDLKNWLAKENLEERMKNLIFIHYDSPFADRDFLEKVKKADSSKQSLFIIEEAHRFINNVYNNVSSKNGKRAQVIYDYIQQEKKENPSVRIMMLSATPAVNNPFEFALIFNLLRPGVFPTSEAIFEQIFISSTNFQSLNENTKNMFQRRILGLVSFYIGATPDKFPTKTIHYKNIIMEKYQENVYNHFEEIEEQREKLNRKLSRGKVGERISTYNAYTRQAANFVFPHITDLINGEARPRPGKFKIKDADAIIIDEGKEVSKIKQLKLSDKEAAAYDNAIRTFVNGFFNLCKETLEKDKKDNYTLQEDVKTWKNKYNSSFSSFLTTEKKKSKLFDLLNRCSPKFITCIFNIFKSSGPVLVYSNYVLMEGLQIFKIYLNFFGFIDYHRDSDVDLKDLTKSGKSDGFRYIEYHGAINRDIREANKKIYNDKENMHGRVVKIIMLSPAGAEGITLRNVRQVHILEPFWNEARIEQIMGRAVRMCVHKDLPMNERKVDVFRYKMIRKSNKITADEKMENISRKKNNLLLSFIEAVKEAAVDCELFKAHNMMGSKYKCFQFNEESLLENPIGPAFNEKLEYDQKIDNGSNAKESTRLKIKVRKIKAVKKIEDNLYSEPEFYWYYEPSGMIYDNDLHFAVGKVEKDLNGNSIKLDNDTYIINDIIDIPEFKIY
jgi:superfamily II DNA or RNA helicase